MSYPSGIVPAATGEGPGRARALDPRGFEPTPARSLTFPFVTGQRRELSVTLTPRPVFDLARRQAVGVRLARVVRRSGREGALAGLSRGPLEVADLKRIDVDTLRHGMGLFEADQAATGVVPAFWRTVAAARGRFALLYAGLEVEVDAGRLLVEVVGLGDSVDLEELKSACGQLEAQRRGVVLHAPPDAASVTRLGAIRPRCIGLDFAGVETQGQVGWQGAVTLISAARAAAENVLLVNLPPDKGEAAAAAGATHAVFCPMQPLRA